MMTTIKICFGAMLLVCASLAHAQSSCYGVTQSQCTAARGCTWDYTSLQCSSSGDGLGASGGSCYGVQQSQCTASRGCTWDYTSLQCSSSSGGASGSCYGVQQSQCTASRGCTWDYTSLQCSSSSGGVAGGSCSGVTQTQCTAARGCTWSYSSLTCSDNGSSSANIYGQNQTASGRSGQCPGKLNQIQCESAGCSWDRTYNSCKAGYAGVLGQGGSLSRGGQGSKTPLVLELDGPVRFTSAAVRFDLLGRKGLGYLPKIGWVEPTAGFLAIDLDGSGRIENGAKLFGSGTRLPNGALAANGFAALAQYDLNGDGVIDRRDPVFARLLVWRNTARDGRATAPELRPLAAYGIEALSLSATQLRPVPTNADAVVYESHYTVLDGHGVRTVKRLVDVYLREVMDLVTEAPTTVPTH